MLLEMLLVVAITDGDTIKVLDSNNQQIKVRLASIDAPECQSALKTFHLSASKSFHMV